MSKPRAAVEEVGVLQIHHFFFHRSVLRLHILLLHCKCADNAVIKENEGLGSNTPFCKELLTFSARNQPHISLKAGRTTQYWQRHASPELFLALTDPRPDKYRRINCMVWTRWNESVQVSASARKIVKRFLPHSQYQLATDVVALVWTTACEGLGRALLVSPKSVRRC